MKANPKAKTPTGEPSTSGGVAVRPREQYPSLPSEQKARRRAARIRARAIQKGPLFTEAELDEMESQWQATQNRDARESKPKP